MKSRKTPSTAATPLGAIRGLLQREDIAGARTRLALALQSAKEPDERLNRLSHLLAPPRVTPSSTTGRDHSRDYEWLRSNASVHRGQWVALLDGVLVATEGSLKHLRAAIAEHPERESLLIHRIE